ncbi:MAG: phosphoribosylanthranilate isomerase [Candidatus Protistobacter heckmanni]|nr:phosphoribosylanthranilate isomerase [Candidatus Protistobacter heckmanni]
MQHRTRIKICGLTREQDVDAAVELGADAVGFVLWPGSPRHVTPARAAELIRRLPPFIMAVGLFVNAEPAEVDAAVAQAPLSALQFHGAESPAYCADAGLRLRRQILRAVRVTPELDLLEFGHAYQRAGCAGLLLDAWSEGYGGSGKTFDWALLPETWKNGNGPRLVLSGGLHARNAAEAVTRVRPWAVDVSSGVEAAKGVKDATKMAEFIAAVRAGDQAVQGAAQQA